MNNCVTIACAPVDKSSNSHQDSFSAINNYNQMQNMLCTCDAAACVCACDLDRVDGGRGTTTAAREGGTIVSRRLVAYEQS